MIKVTNCLVCDDVRQEMTGKVILIGVYGSDMILRQPVPENSTVGLCLWTEFKSSEGGGVELRAVVEGAPDQPSEMIAYTVSINLPESPEALLQAWGQFLCRTDFPHALRFEYKVPDGEWQFLRRLQIRQSPLQVD